VANMILQKGSGQFWSMPVELNITLYHHYFCFFVIVI